MLEREVNPTIRIRWKKLGGHYHCRFFTAPAQGQTFAKCGDLVFDEHEWRAVKGRLQQGADIEFLEDQ